MKQPFVHGQPDCGKTTLAMLLKDVYFGWTFEISQESSGEFMGQEFVDKREGAIWIEEEITSSKFQKMPPEIFNKVTEGQTGFTVSIKRLPAEEVTSSFHVLMMSNFTVKDLCPHTPLGDPGQPPPINVRMEEFEARFETYETRKPDTPLRPEATAAPNNCFRVIHSLIDRGYGDLDRMNIEDMINLYEQDVEFSD